MTFEPAMRISNQDHPDDNNVTNAILGQIFCREHTICYYFNESCYLIDKMQHLIKLSARYCLHQVGWTNFFLRFHVDLCIGTKKSKYCIKFTSFLPKVLEHFLSKHKKIKDIDRQLLRISIL